MDETSQKIIAATMFLIRDKGYAATTTKDIAKKAGVNECTLFRRFSSKKDIVLCGVEQQKWRGLRRISSGCPLVSGSLRYTGKRHRWS